MLARHHAVGTAEQSGQYPVLNGMGAWNCDLHTEALSWTAGVYDLFGFPRGTKVDRREAVAMYAEGARETLHRLRSDAIANRGMFTMDAEIAGADGRSRWMRLTAGVTCKDGRPVQLYGIKQDITASVAHREAMRRLSQHGRLTGLASRRVFLSRFLDAPRHDATIAEASALVLIDVEGIDRINYRFGHDAGDDCLRTVATRLSASFQDATMIARIASKRFAIVMPQAVTPPALDLRIKRALRRLTLAFAWKTELLAVTAFAGAATMQSATEYDAELLYTTARADLHNAKRSAIAA